MGNSDSFQTVYTCCVIALCKYYWSTQKTSNEGTCRRGSVINKDSNIQRLQSDFCWLGEAHSKTPQRGTMEAIWLIYFCHWKRRRRSSTPTKLRRERRKLIKGHTGRNVSTKAPLFNTMTNKSSKNTNLLGRDDIQDGTSTPTRHCPKTAPR